MATDTLPEIIEITDAAPEHEPGYRILIHNDDVTPFGFVIVVLRRVFELSREIAEHVTLTAHIKGVALVAVRPRSEAKRLVQKAHLAARLEGFPLTFSIEPEE
ncbi:MAG TPA: ATP-dependent Clp protease adaptor ClpS [Caldilineae bacterium]|nr:ATP-dependent Clp protease adaptor ClpS [Caldilineae bacterium]